MVTTTSSSSTAIYFTSKGDKIMNFNYAKAYCTQATPAFLALPDHVKQAHADLLPLVGELQQGESLGIPISAEIAGILEPLTILEIAEMSRASYYVGHWHPGLLPWIFDNTKGGSWKVTNCCDQVLREQLLLPGNVKIHGGVLRVTYSGKDTWLWQEFALATQENLMIFEKCTLSFCGESLEKSAQTLAASIGDLWGVVDAEETNKLYGKYSQLSQAKRAQDIRACYERTLKGLEKDKLSTLKKLNFYLLCNQLHINTDNAIYYAHKDAFCFGWKDKLSAEEQEGIIKKLKAPCKGLYNIEFK